MTPTSAVSTIHPIHSRIEDYSNSDLEEHPLKRREPTSAPRLISPDQICSGYHLVNAITGLCELRNSMLTTTTLRMETMKLELEDASAKLMQKLKEAAECAKSCDFWSMLKKVANCVLSALSSIFGLSLLASGGSALVGGCLLASGLLSLSNLVLSECAGWDKIADQLADGCEEKKQQLLLILPASVGLLAAGFGLVGSVYAITSGALDFTGKAGSIAQTALSLFAAATNLGKGTSDSRLIWAQADLNAEQETLKIKQTGCERLYEEINTQLEGFNRIFYQAKKAVRTLTQTQSTIIR